MASGALNDNAAMAVKKVIAEGAPNINALGTITTNVAVTLPDPTLYDRSVVTLSTTSTIAFTLPAPSVGKRLRLEIIQDGTGSRLASFATSSGGLQWAGSAAPTLTTTALHADVLEFECFDGTNFVGHVLAANVH